MTIYEADFERDGFAPTGCLIDPIDVERLRVAFEALFAGEYETGVQPDEVNWREGVSDPGVTRQICNGWKANRDIARVVLDAGFGERIARAAGWSGVRLMHDNVLWKPAGARSLSYHQDNAYLRWFVPGTIVTLWIALDDTSAAGGTMELVRGSHRWRPSSPAPQFHDPTDYLAPMREAAAREGVEPDIAHVEVPVGAGSLHHGWCWHGSGPNRGTTPRRSLVIHAMPADARFDRANLHVGNGPVYARYAKLVGDEMDESHFPITWRDDGYRTPGLDVFAGKAPAA